MKRIYMFAVLAIAAFTHLQAQSIAVNTSGTAADNSSILDVSSTDKGVLVPRMSKTQRLAITNPATGLMLYQNAPDSTGFYFFNGIKWDWLVGNNVLDTLSWHTSGNAGTNISRHFIGTSDSTSLLIKTYNSERIRIGADGKIGVGINNPFTKFCNTATNIGGTDTIGLGNASSAWLINEIGYTQAIYNASPLIHANGLAIKIKGTSSKNTLLDLSTNTSQSAPGIPVFTALGNGNIGIGTNTPFTRLSNTATNIVGTDGFGAGTYSFTWQTSENAYNTTLYNNNPASKSNGLAVKIKGTAATNMLLDLSTGSALVPGTPVFAALGNGNIGIGINNPITKLTNNAILVAGSNAAYAGPNSINWKVNEDGFTNAMYNASVSGNAHGLSVKINGTSNSNTLLDLSTGSSQNVAGAPVFSVLGSGKIGIGTNTPFSKLSNTPINIAGSNGAGVGLGSFSWQMNEDGFTNAIYNASTSQDAHGLAVKIAGSSPYNILLDLSSAVVQNLPGNSAFVVRADGKTGVGTSAITETLTVNGALNITDGGYSALANDATTPAPAGGAGTISFSNGHFFGWNGSAWKQLDN